MKLTISFFLLLIISTGCHKHQSTVSDHQLNELANCSCKAISLRKQRFELANKIRFLQDTLGDPKRKGDYPRLRADLALDLKQKDILLKSSLLLADTIHHKLDSIMPYNDKEAQKRFTIQLKNILAKKGCQDVNQ